MLVLREMTADGQEYNRVIGGDYSPCMAKSLPDIFERGIRGSSETDEEAAFYIERSFGWISHNHGKDIIRLAKGKIYYMMGSDGGTFATYKE